MTATRLRTRVGSLRRPLLGTAVGGGALLFAAGGAPASAATGVTFGNPVYVSRTLGGGEPFVARSVKDGTLVYSSHEGTTHLFRDGVVQPSTACAPGQPQPSGFLCSYRNEVNVWTSTTQGRGWTQTTVYPTGFTTTPDKGLGFSDPDLTQDAAGNLYDTGIDLANDALFSSSDGGHHFDTGTAMCHDGDRPWLAGAGPNEVFLATDTVEGSGSGHEVFRSTDAGASCGTTGIADNGPTANGGSYSGYGKLYYDTHDGSLIEPAVFSDSGGATVGVGISVLHHASAAFASGSGKFVPHMAATTTLQAHWPAIAVDAANTVYVVWDTDARAPGTSGGCGGAPSPLANRIMMAYTRDEGATWSRPITVAAPPVRVLWPWIQAGAAGDVSVVWYAYDRVTDPDCGHGAVSVMEATILGATSGSPVIDTVDAVGRPVHRGGICQGGTTCVATGQDRRLGDYFTNAVDRNGCVMIATGDTMLTDPTTGGQLATSRPLFVEQTGGPGLYGHACGTTAAGAASSPARPLGMGVAATGLAGVAASAVRRRRRTAL